MSPLPTTRRARAVTVTAVTLLGLAVAPLAVAPTAGAASAATSLARGALGQAASAPRTVPGQLAVDFDPLDRTTKAGQPFVASGTVRAADAAAGDRGVASRFRLALVDATGAELAGQDVTTDDTGSFRTAVPAAATRGADAAAVTTLALRALDVRALTGGPTTTDAGAGAVPLAAAATGLALQNSFVSSVGWVKPGEEYPSTITVTNTGTTPVAAVTVAVAAPPKGSTIEKATPSAGTAAVASGGQAVTWELPAVPAANAATGAPGQATLVLESRAATTTQDDEVVWRDLSTTATLSAAGQDVPAAVAHGPKVIPPSSVYDTARYGDRPFPIVPVQYTDRAYQANHTGEALAAKINSREEGAGSTYNLFQEMSLGQLYPEGTVPSAGKATADFTYGPGFDLQKTVLGQTCTGVTVSDLPIDVKGTPLYPARITNGIYNLPGQTQFYGADSNGSAVIGSLAGVGALQNIDSGCGPTGKLVHDAAALADPEVDYSDFDTDKDGVVDFFMVVFAGCGGNGASQLGACSDAQSDTLPYDNIWPHSSSLEGEYTDAATGLPGFATDDQLKDLEGRPLWWTDTTYTEKTTTPGPDTLKVFVRVGPYNVNPETAIDKASVISHEYGHSLGLPDFYSTGSRETYGDWNLMATDKSQNMDAYARQELGWVVPRVLPAGQETVVKDWRNSKQDIDRITWRTPDGTPYTLVEGADGRVQNSEMYVAKLPGRTLLDAAAFDTGAKASADHLWWSGSGNDFGCSPTSGRNFDVSIPGLENLPAGTTLSLKMKSRWDIEWDFDHGFVLTTSDGGETYTSHASQEGYTTSNTDPLAGNPNSNGCQATYDNGITGTSGSYAAGTEVTDRKLGNTPAPVFVADSFDISDLVGKDKGTVRLSYATDPGLARPGWFIDDMEVVATTGGVSTTLWRSDFETSGGPSDTAVFNGGCRESLSTGGRCTLGWKYLQAGAQSEQDHAYYLEMRDRSSFDFDGRGEADRGAAAFEAGLYLAYTDEAHGYGNAGTDDPPAQSPIDSTPTPGSQTPELDDAAFTTAAARSRYTDATATPHVDNYTDPSTTSTNWEFAYDCLSFKVDRLEGTDAAAASNLTGDVTFKLGTGCGAFNYGAVPETPKANTKPTATATATPSTATVGQQVTLSAAGSTDKETPGNLTYSWDTDGDEVKDAEGAEVTRTFTKAGTYTATVTVSDAEGLTDTASTTVTVTTPPAGDTTKPTIRTTVRPTPVLTGRTSTLSAAGSTDDRTASGRLRYFWDRVGEGGAVDAQGPTLPLRYATPGVKTVTLYVVDEAGNVAVRTLTVRVLRHTACGARGTTRVGDFTVVRSQAAIGGTYCLTRRSTRGTDAVRTTVRGGSVDVYLGRSPRGGTGAIYVDGRKVRSISFEGGSRLTLDNPVRLRGLGSGTHRIEVRRLRGQAAVGGFVTYQ
ncbi:PKD domain-containing protein [Nocardioides litoris]|uniref:PKD domain-containing protein n=1 Tax=Nocardioides litoris TaxID=1926648 RepID=UPI0011242150|nr:PKD domain-containing protein [Nocardioides litoris]